MNVEEIVVNHETLIPINLTINKPFNFCEYFPQIDIWERSFRLSDGTFVLTTTYQDDHPSNEIFTEIQSQGKLAESNVHEVISRLNFELGVNERLHGLKIAATRDFELKRALYTQPGFRLFANSSLVEILSSIIFSQKTTLDQYYDKKKEFVKTYGTEIPWDSDYTVFPSRSTLLNISVEQWEEMNLLRKGTYIRHFMENLDKINTFLRYPDINRGFQHLSRFEGLGAYSTRALLVYGSRRYNYPFLNSYIRRQIHEIYQIHDNITYSTYKDWCTNKFGRDPALAIHCLLAANYPAELKDITLDLQEDFLNEIS